MAGSPQTAFLAKCLIIASRAGIPKPRVCIETGTYQGAGTLALKEHFETVHTIELSEKWYQYSAQKLAAVKGITCHHGDSAHVLAGLLPQLSEPVVLFLDAHFAGGDTARGVDEVPLLRELEVISKRPYADLLIVDDLRLIGKRGQSGAAGDPTYPLMTFDWRDISLGQIARIVNQRNRAFWMFGDDRIVIFRTLTLLQLLRARLAALKVGSSARLKDAKTTLHCFLLGLKKFR